jgi:multidrug resistance efflux pump
MARGTRLRAFGQELMGSPGVVRVVAVAAVVAAAAAWIACAARSGSSSGDDGASATVTVARGTFERTVRVAGITEAIRASAAIAPRLAGQSSPTLVITKLVKGGTRVKADDVLVEFDQQEQIRAAFDRRTDFQDLEQQIRRVEAEQAAAWAGDETAMTQAANDVARARLVVRTNKVLPAIESEKNTLALEEAEAREKEVREARMLRRQTAEASLKRLHIQRGRSERAMTHAEQNTQNMVVRAPFDGLIVMQPIFRGSALTEIQEGDEVRAGVPIAQIVDPSSMQVRARVSQIDAGLVKAGQRARIFLDAYPGSSFDGTVKQVAPLAITSSVTPVVRAFVTLVTVAGSDATLMPDLSAAADIVVDRREHVLVVPRDAVIIDAAGVWVQLRQGGSFMRQKVTLGGVSDLQAVIASGVAEGAVVARRAAGVN